MNNRFGFTTMAAELRERHKDWLGQCDYCAWPIKATVEEGCVEMNCSQRPLPPKRYDTEMRQDFRKMLRAIENAGGDNPRGE